MTHSIAFQVLADPTRLRIVEALRAGEMEKWLAGYRTLWEARLDRLGEALEERRRKGSTRKEPR